jgi:hypothetical protein
VLRGWKTAHKYLSERKQHQMLLDAGVPDRGDATPIYDGKDGWTALIRSLRHSDEVVVADLRIFGSRARLGEATAEVESREATLVVAKSDVHIHPPTLREAHETERKWAGERGAMGSRKRARALSARGIEAYRAKLERERMPKAEVEARWRAVADYATRADAVRGTGWTVTTAWRHFGPRERK